MANQGEARELSQGSSQALLGILRSIAPDVVPEDGGKLNEEDIKKINERLVEVLGKDVTEQYKNERGELVNEEGLPIIEITEPAETVDVTEVGTAHIAEEDQLIPLVSLPEAQRERLRQDRERILDILEEEERLEEKRERERFLEERKEVLQNKIEEAAKEKGRAIAAKKMQKKMGRALLGADEEEENKKSDNSHLEGKVVSSESAKPKKSVSFASEPAESVEEKEQENWGDISLARLRSTNRPTLLGRLEENKEPMKMKVVERKPVGRDSIKQQRPGDSDDDSNPDEQEGKASDLDDESGLHEDQPPEDSAPESDVTDESLEDLDYARHQREIALEYYAKRGVIGQAAAQALMSHSQYEDEEEAPADIGVTEHPSSKPSISRFKASKLASSYNASLPSQFTSLEGSVLSASSAKTLQRAIRAGKLDSENRLVKADDVSESEGENEAVQQVLELLSKGELYNLGPQGDRVIYAVPPQKEGLKTGIITAMDKAALPPLHKSKNSTSKFKADRSQAGPSKAGQGQGKSASPTPTVLATPPTASAVVERQPPGKSKAIDSPSFRPPKTISTQKQDPYDIQRPMVIDSPSFNPTQGPISSAPFSMIVESPSFFSTPSKPLTSTETMLNSPNAPTNSRRPTRPPVVISSVVREKTTQPEKVEAANPPKSKVSRFLADRM